MVDFTSSYCILAYQEVRPFSVDSNTPISLCHVAPDNDHHRDHGDHDDDMSVMRYDRKSSCGHFPDHFGFTIAVGQCLDQSCLVHPCFLRFKNGPNFQSLANVRLKVVFLLNLKLFSSAWEHHVVKVEATEWNACVSVLGWRKSARLWLGRKSGPCCAFFWAMDPLRSLEIFWNPWHTDWIYEAQIFFRHVMSPRKHMYIQNYPPTRCSLLCDGSIRFIHLLKLR